MRLASKFWRIILAGWLNLRLLGSLGQFLIWFGWQTYTKSSVLLISFIWFSIATLLVIQQQLFWNLPDDQKVVPDYLSRVTELKTTTQKIWHRENLIIECGLRLKLAKKFPSHRDLAINASLCQNALENKIQAIGLWNQAKSLDPNSKIFSSSTLKVSADN